MTDFGAFIELEPGIDALLHVSQISKEHIEKPSNVLSIGQEVTSMVVEFNKDDRKISLSIKAMDSSEDESEPAIEEVPQQAPAKKATKKVEEAPEEEVTEEVVEDKAPLEEATGEEASSEEE